MFDKKEIIARLQNGEDIQVIANEMAAVINEAQDEYKAQKAEAEQKELQKKEELNIIIEMCVDWFCKHYGFQKEKIGTVDADQVLVLIDECKEYVDALAELEAVLKPKKTIKKPAKDAQATIDDFIKQMGW